MDRRAETEFHRIVRQKGWTLKQVGERWGVGVRQMTRIAQGGNIRDLDAANGLPDKRNEGEL